MLSLGFAGGIALASSSQSNGVKWLPLNAPKALKAKEAPAPAASAPVPKAQPALEVPTVQPPQTGGVTSAAPQVNAPLEITCLGAGTADKRKAVPTFGNSTFSGIAGNTLFSGSSSGTAWTITHHDRGFTDQVDVRLFSGDDRIRMPRTMLPGIHGGDHGWFKLKGVVADARSIRGSAAVSLLNNPKVFIDRVTGTISISGKSGDYSGQCEVIDASKPKF